MKRLAIHTDALNDYKAKKIGTSNGDLFNKISSEMSQFRMEKLDN